METTSVRRDSGRCRREAVPVTCHDIWFSRMKAIARTDGTPSRTPSTQFASGHRAVQLQRNEDQ